jgi:predicted PolB exonuclease-like 3'-5' exonuclease
MSSYVIVWDLETVPDSRGYAAANDMGASSDEEVRQAIGDKFPKHIYHSIVCIGALVAHRTDGIWVVDALGAPHVGDRTEKQLITAFVDRIAELSPQLITFNGHSFDLPVLRYRAMINKVSAPGLSVRPYFDRYRDDALDLCDALSSFSPNGKATLHEISRVLGLPGKPDSIDGGEVHRYFQNGKIQQIADYCETDIVNTYRVWLRYELFRGRLSAKEFDASERALAENIQSKEGTKPHLKGMGIALREVDGIGPRRAERIIAAWAEQKIVREIMIFLHSHGVGTSRAVRIYKTYGNDAVQLMSENPYRLAKDIRGIGFKTADAIASRLGIAKDAMIRVRAGISYALTEALNEGHCGLPVNELSSLAEKLLEVPAALIETAMALELAERTIVKDSVEETECVFLAGLYQAEKGIAERILRLAAGKPSWPEIDSAKAIDWLATKSPFPLAHSQKQAAELALRSKVLVITGGPGVGNPPDCGSTSSSLWMVLASSPVASLMRLAARPVGAQRSISTCFAFRMRRIEFTIVVLAISRLFASNGGQRRTTGFGGAGGANSRGRLGQGVPLERHSMLWITMPSQKDDGIGDGMWIDKSIKVIFESWH